MLGRLLKSTPPNFYSPRPGEAAQLSTYHTTYVYDTRDNLLEKTSPDAGTVRYKYDTAGRMRFSKNASQASNHVAFTRYDGFSRPIFGGVASGVNLTTFNNLDPNSQHSFETTTSNRRHAWHYDGTVPTGSFPWNQISSGRYSGFAQTNLKGRLSARAYRSGNQWQVEIYGYDANGRVLRKRVLTQDMSNTRDAPYYYTYDRQGRITYRETLVGGNAFFHWYDYDPYGRLSKVFAAASYPSKPGTPEVTYTYNPDGQKASEHFRGASLEVPYLYTIRGWVREIGAPRDANYPHPFSALYTYTAGGNVWTAEYFQKNSPHSEKGYRYTHSYDGLDRLKGATYALWASGSMFFSSSKFGENEISYDRNGNITKLRRRGNSTTLADDLTYNHLQGRNRLTGISDAAGATQGWDWGTLAMGHDANGNVSYYYDASRDIYHSATYDERNLMTYFYFEDYDTWTWGSNSYRYNADGQRYWKKDYWDSSAEYYLLDGAVTLGVFSPNGSLDWNIVTPWGEVIGRRTSTGQWRYYAKDHLGSTRAVVTSTGSIVEVRDYYPFGLHMPGRSMVSGAPAKQGFTGHELDAESGLIYAGARYYIPNIGRWTGVDPLADKYPGWSLYNYVLNNPLRFNDPTGMTPECAERDDEGYCVLWQEQEVLVTAEKSRLDLDTFGAEICPVTGKSIKSHENQSLINVAEPSVQSANARQPADNRAPSTSFWDCLGNCIIEQFPEIAIGAGLVASGYNWLKAGPKPGGTVSGTSPAARAANAVFGDRRFTRPMPTLVFTGERVAVRYTKSVARFAGRAVPVVGWGILIWDAGAISVCTYKCNTEN